MEELKEAFRVIETSWTELLLDTCYDTYQQWETACQEFDIIREAYSASIEEMMYEKRQYERE